MNLSANCFSTERGTNPEDGDDGNNDQEFDQGEGEVNWMLGRHFNPGRFAGG